MYKSVVKRVLDFLLALAGTIVLSPLLLALAAWVKLDSKGPVFFRQKRVGRDKRLFSILKFRSMYADTPHDVLDMKIFFKTIFNVLAGRGVVEGGTQGK